ncbi:hypothetical protein AB0D12_16655 [Streptomyces sp. NPDC048479]
MSDEREPNEPPTQDDREAARREELLAKVREANKQSAARPR